LSQNGLAFLVLGLFGDRLSAKGKRARTGIGLLLSVLVAKTKRERTTCRAPTRKLPARSRSHPYILLILLLSFTMWRECNRATLETLGSRSVTSFGLSSTEHTPPAPCALCVGPQQSRTLAHATAVLCCNESVEHVGSNFHCLLNVTNVRFIASIIAEMHVCWS
jgi:hypothetical protein